MPHSDFVLPLVKKVGEIIDRAYRSDLVEFSEKGKTDYLTKIDTDVEQEIRKALKREYPD
ncbi:inositol monophosphatase, partial [Candidatus Micrarchaeota archaeon]|nr:inositol monophosphatase [Candidatus Micrarchaeota archaeon]